MAIRFTCQCGKPLKAREESAGRRTVCPQCGGPVGIPALRPTHRGVTGMPGESRRTHQPYRAPSCELAEPPAPATVHAARPKLSLPEPSRTASLKARPRRRRARAVTPSVAIRKRSRTRWLALCGRRGRRGDAVEFGSFNPFLSVAGLSAALTVSVSLVIILLPAAQQQGWTALPHGPFFFGALFVMLAAIGYGCSWAGRILSFAAQGKTQDFAFDLKLESAAGGLARWLGCFAAGPVLPAFVGFVYWLNCGEMVAIDGLIVGEFAFVATAWWLTLLVTSDAGGGVRGILPDRAFVNFCRLGPRGIALTLLTAALLFAVGIVLSRSASLIHAADWSGVLLLALCCVCGPLLMTLILRRLGEAYHRSAASIPARPPIAPSQSAAAAR